MSRSTAGRIAHRSLVLSVLCGALALSACSSRTEAATPSGGAAATTAPAATETVTGTAVPASTSPAKTPSAGETLTDGVHRGYLTKIDTSARTVSFDKVEMLTGAAAVKAYQKANPGATDGPPNDYFIVNDNKLVRTLPVGNGVTVTVVKSGEAGITNVASSFGKLPGYLAGNGFGNLFDLTVKDGTVTSLAAVYVP